MYVTRSKGYHREDPSGCTITLKEALHQAPEDDPFAEGMQKIYKQFTTTMEGMGVEPIEAVGKEFKSGFPQCSDACGG